ncbi:site-specific integrase [Halalkalicoccus salilacus]|uniref:hypothetical protein n=1 Tax=Halalkalicoccus salilacus TaxID=3117459 RepID=UPI0038D39BA0
MFLSRQSDRMSQISVWRLLKKATRAAGMRPFVAGAGRGGPSGVSPHTFRHSITFRLIRREDKRSKT